MTTSCCSKTRPEKLGNKVNTYASLSCVWEHDAVYVHIGCYGTARPSNGRRGLGAPVLDRGRVWMLTANGVLYAIDAKTGQQRAALRVGGSFIASPVIAGDSIYACDEEDGSTTVVRQSPAENRGQESAQ